MKKTEVADQPIDTDTQLFYNGDILTMAADVSEYAEAVVEQNGKIVFVGNKKEAEKKYKNAKNIDLNGKTMFYRSAQSFWDGFQRHGASRFESRARRHHKNNP